MSPEFTGAQLARQKAIEREEKLGLATLIINVLAAIPPILMLFPPVVVAAPVITVVDLGFKINRYIMLAAE